MIQPRLFKPAAVAFVIALLTGSGRAAEVIVVPSGGSLQNAIDRAQPGDAIILAPGAVYSGNFLLPVKPGNQFITIRTADQGGLPRAGQRVTPGHAPRLAKIQSPNSLPAVRTAPGAHHWRLQLLEFPATHTRTGDIITLGDGSQAQTELAQAPRELIVDRCYIHGDPVMGQKRGIALNSAATTITSSYISDIKAKGQDTQAIGGWNGPGPYTIENNYLEAAGENFLLGGADPAIQGLVTSDVVFRRNHLSKPIAWRAEGWLVKNLFELKNARRVLVEGNLMEYAWPHGQSGYAVLFTPRNQDGKAPWVTVEDVTFRYNIVRHAAAGMQIIGNDTNHPSGPTRRVRVVDNLFYAIDSRPWGGNGTFLLIGEGPSEVAIEHNTIIQTGNIATAYGGTTTEPTLMPGFRFTDNLIRHNEFGFHGANRGGALDALNFFFPGSVFRGNGIAGGDARRFPAGNIFVTELEFEREFENLAAADFRLRPTSRFRGTATDGRNVGADLNAIAQAAGARQR